MNNSRATSVSAIKTWVLAMSTTVFLIGSLATTVAPAHELEPAIADVTVTQSSVRAEIDLALEPLILGIDLDGLENTDDAAESDQYDAMRELAPGALRDRFDLAWADIKPEIRLLANGVALDVTVDAIDIPDVGELALARVSTLRIAAELPDDGSAITFGWAARLGSLIVRQIDPDGEVAYAVLLSSGADSAPMPRTGPVHLSTLDNAIHYTVVGFEHIVPKGLDHILFVLGLFFFALKLRPLLIQVTAFTFAHTVTLALASLGHVNIPASVVEPLIALSIVYIAVENIRGGNITWVRTAVVFAFGLLHGLGFAYVLGEVGLNASQFIASLIAFNVGVELGQLSVIAVAFVLVGLPFGKQDWYRKGIAIPCSLVIAAVGAYWSVERVVF